MNRLAFLPILCLLLVPIQTEAAEKIVKFVWEYTQGEEQNISHFEILNGKNVVVVPSIPKSARMANHTITHDGKTCQVFYIRAVDNTDPLNIEYSGNSDIQPWCPGKRVILVPGGFSGQ